MVKIGSLFLLAFSFFAQYLPPLGLQRFAQDGYTTPVPSTIPVVTSFSVSASQGSIGTAVDVCWEVGFYPTSVAVTTGIAGTVTTYTDSVNPRAGCKTLTIASNSRIRLFGDSIDCGFRTTGAAVHANDPNLPCAPGPALNGSPNAYLPYSLHSLSQQGVAVPASINNAVVGATLQGQTPASCTGSGFYPDITIVAYELFDTSQSTNPASYNAAISAWWATSKASGCVVIARSLTLLANAFDVTLQPLQNAYIQANWQTSATALIDVGADQFMGCLTCNQVGHPTFPSGAALFTTLDCTPTCPNGTPLTHWSDAGHVYAGANYVVPALRTALRIPVSIVATNANGSSATMTIPGVLVMQ